MRTCVACGATAPLHFVACPSCLALFHADELSRLNALAESSERQGDVLAALDALRKM